MKKQYVFNYVVLVIGSRERRSVLNREYWQKTKNCWTEL